MHIEGPNADRKPEVDFRDWNWGELDLDSSPLKLVADRVAEVLWAEIVDSVKNDGYARFSAEESGEPTIIVGLLDTHFLVIPLSDIIIEDEEDGHDDDVPKWLRQWADAIEERRRAAA
jgi:hypothetical protein